jgi:NADPH-dependent curcumin reductase CurA
MAISTNRFWQTVDGQSGIGIGIGVGERQPYVGTFTIKTEPIPMPSSGQLLARARFMSIDRCVYNGQSDPGGADGRIPAGAVAEVIESHDLATPVGSLVQTDDFGWQEFAALDARCCLRVDESIAPPEAWLSYLGAPGLTAWLALEAAGGVQPGEAVLVSDAAGAVGQLAGQLIKSKGGIAIGIVGAEEQREWCLQIGFDAVVDHHSIENLCHWLLACCPQGVDLFIDNMGGAIHGHSLACVKTQGRVIVCGLAGHVGALAIHDNETDQHWLRQIQSKRLHIQGFNLYDHAERFVEARNAIIQIAQVEEFDYLFDIVDGFNALPDALLRLRSGMNVGKQLVKIC